MATSKVDVANRASIMIGGAVISSLDPPDDSVEAIVAANLYEDILNNLIATYPWRFCMKQMQLSRSGDSPEARWDAAYEIPADALIIRTVTVNGEPIEYDRYGEMILCNASADDAVIADYLFRPNEAAWPPYFTLLMEYVLAQAMAPGVTGRANLVDSLSQMVVVQERKARQADSQSTPTRKVRTTRFLNYR